MKRKNRAQTFIGYAVLIAVVVAGLLVMKAFLTRTMHEKYRQSADVWGRGEQYEVGRSSAEYKGSSWENKKEKCPEIVAHVQALEEEVELLNKRMQLLQKEIDELLNRAAQLRQHAADVEAQARRLEAEGLIEEAEALRRNIIPPLLEEAAKLEEEAARKQIKLAECQQEQERIRQQIIDIKANYPQCFGG